MASSNEDTSCTSHLEKIQKVLSSKEKMLTEAALGILVQKRNNLSLQHRMIGDEIAICEKNIQTIENGGGDDLLLKLESIIDGCKDDTRLLCCERHLQILENRFSILPFKSKKLSEAVLSIRRNAIQELDGVCHENNWTLPAYSCLSLSGGGFQANVSVRGMEFECAYDGPARPTPREAREAAAFQLLAQLRAMTTT